MRGRGGNTQVLCNNNPPPGVARISHQGLTFFSLIIPGWKIYFQQNRLPLRAGSQGCFPQVNMLVSEVEKGLRGVWAGHRQLPAHRIWEASAHSTAVLDGAADLSVICLIFLAKGRMALTQHIAAAGHAGFAWHIMASVAVFVPVLPVQAKEDAHGRQHMKMCLAWH